MRALRAMVGALIVALAMVPAATGFAATPAARVDAPSRDVEPAGRRPPIPAAESLLSPPGTAPSYAAREAAAQDLQQFAGGNAVYIGGSTLVVVLLIVLIIIII